MESLGASLTRAVLAFQQAIWRVALENDFRSQREAAKKRPFVALSEKAILKLVPQGLHSEAEQILRCLRDSQLIIPPRVDTSFWRFSLEVFDPVTVSRRVFPDQRDEDLKYALFRAIRREGCVALAAATVRSFHEESTLINRLASEVTNPGDSRQGITVPFGRLERTLGPNRLCSAFFAAARTAGLIRVAREQASVFLPRSLIDPEFLLSQLFGLWTTIPGLNDLFGGAGPIFADADSPEPAMGRAMLVSGRYGTGKTILALELCAEVARKGGFACYLPLEQSVEDCLYTLESFEFVDRDTFALATTGAQVAANRSEYQGRGVLVIIEAGKLTLDEHLDQLLLMVADANKFPLRLVAIDPISSVDRLSKENLKSRRTTVSALRKIKNLGGNALLVSESPESSMQGDNSDFLENLSDTVIRLSLDTGGAYARRFLEVAKSRLQREQRGRHPFVITSSKGVTVLPSSAAIKARVAARAYAYWKNHVRFGDRSLDIMLKRGAISQGDLIVVRGPRDVVRTALGMEFILTQDFAVGGDSLAGPRAGGGEALWVTVAGSEEVVRARCREVWNRVRHESDAKVRRRKDDRVFVKALRSGFVVPGYVFNSIEEALLRSEARGQRIERVVIDNVDSWDRDCPFIRADGAFADSLTDMLRKRGATLLVLCSERASIEEGSVQAAFVGLAVSILDIQRTQFRGRSGLVLGIRRTRSGAHDREFREVSLDRDLPHIQHPESPIRYGVNNDVEAVTVQLFLHSDTAEHEEYNDRFAESIRSSYGTNVEVRAQSFLLANDFAGSSQSPLDTLVVSHVDEYQLGGLDFHSDRNDDKSIEPEQWAATRLDLLGSQLAWGEFDPEMAELAARGLGGRERCIAIPYSRNRSFLVSNPRDPAVGRVNTWEDLTEAQRAWRGDEDAVFFDFPGGTNENYNCLFLEILASKKGAPEPKGTCRFISWLSLDDATESAAMVFVEIARSAYRRHKLTTNRTAAGVVQPTTKAQVWRQWFSTLRSLDRVSERDRLQVSSLPGGWTTAGDWFVSIPINSGIKWAGLRIIQTLCSRSAELERLRYGVGLPTRPGFYELRGNGRKRMGLDHDNVHSATKGAKVIRRSEFGCYRTFSSVLFDHLVQMLEGGSSAKPDVRAVRRILRSLEASLRFVCRAPRCAGCLGRTSS